MYYFSKVDSNDSHIMKFRHNIFKRGKQDQYHTITRRNKTRDQIINNLQKNYTQTLNILQNQSKLSQETKSLIRIGIQYHSVCLKNLKKIKNSMQQLKQQMKTVRNKQVKNSLAKIKQQNIPSINRLIQQQKNLQIFVKDSLCRDILYQAPQIQPSFASQNIFSEQLRTFKQVQVPKVCFYSQLSILNFKSNCSLENNLNLNIRQIQGQNDDDISLQLDLKENQKLS